MSFLSGAPSASVMTLQQRAQIFAAIRQFFAVRGVLEVETPILSRATVTDPHITSIAAYYQAIGSMEREKVYLQTSPEYAMKRLLVAGTGAIYQISKAFRQGERGRYHNPEFTMLEWYRLGIDHHGLMEEMDELLQAILQTPMALRMTYGSVFKQHVGIDPHYATVNELVECAKQYAILDENTLETDRNFWLDLLFTHCIGSHLEIDRPVFLYDFPVSQAALAKVRLGQPSLVSRFEVYYQGIELANGFHELQNAKEQRQRFEEDLSYRKNRHIDAVPIDEHLLAALERGMPDCSGVALGIDRLVMLALKQQTIADVLSFSFDHI